MTKPAFLSLLLGLGACDASSDDPTGSAAATDRPTRDAAPAPLPDAGHDPLPDAAPAPMPDAAPAPMPDAAPAPLPDAAPDPLPDAAPDPLPDAAPDPLPDAAPDPDVGPPPVGRLCGQDFLDELAPLIVDLLLISESDYPLDPILLPADGRLDVDIADAVALYPGGPGAPTETRPAANLRERLVRLDDPEDPIAIENFERFGTLFDFLEGQLDGEVYLRVGEVEVHLYYLGRTACGELAGFHSVSIET